MHRDSEYARNARALKLADIDKICATEGPQAADAALCRLRDERREAKGIVDPPDEVSVFLGDLEVGGDEMNSEVIECLDELDALAEDPPKAETSAAAAPAAAVSRSLSPPNPNPSRILSIWVSWTFLPRPPLKASSPG